jgi:hypothetical protein
MAQLGSPRRRSRSTACGRKADIETIQHHAAASASRSPPSGPHHAGPQQFDGVVHQNFPADDPLFGHVDLLYLPRPSSGRDLDSGWPCA